MDLTELEAVGPFFAVRTGMPRSAREPHEAGYLPMADFHAAGGSALADRVRAVADTLRTDETRVAASIAFQGVAARLWSIASGAAVLYGRLPDLAPDRLWWNPGVAAPGDLWLPGARPAPSAADRLPRDTAALAEGLRAGVLDGHLRPLLEATRAVCPVSTRLLWGNAGSALAGTLRMLHGRCAEVGDTDAARRAGDLVRELFSRPPLQETGTLAAAERAPWAAPAFRRRSCCLYYRVPGGGLCGDCVLVGR